MELPISERVKKQNLSFIASLNQKVIMLSREGKSVIKLSGGDPSHVPEGLLSIMQDFGDLIEASMFSYSPIAGFDSLLKLLGTLASPRYQNTVKRDNVFMCAGGCQGLFLVFKTLINPGDRVLIQDPCWEYLPRLIENCNGVPVRIHFFSNPSLENHWEDLILELEQHLKTGIKAVSFNSPLNPSGTVIPLRIKNTMIQLCERYGAWFISDDVTIDFNYVEPHPIAIDNRNNFISVNSFSKNLGITGMRFGFIIGSERIINELKKSQLYTSMYPNSLIQKIIEQYLSSNANEYHDFIEKTTSLYQSRASDYTALFSTIPGLEVSKPDGGLFLFPKIKSTHPLNFELLVEQYHIAVSPGEAFSTECKKYFRVFLGVDKASITRAVEILKQIL